MKQIGPTRDQPLVATPIYQWGTLPFVASCLEFQEDQDQTKPDTGYHNTHMAAAAVLCREEQNLPQSAGSSTSSNPPPTRKVDLPGPAAHPQQLHEGQKKEEDGN